MKLILIDNFRKFASSTRNYHIKYYKYFAFIIVCLAKVMTVCFSGIDMFLKIRVVSFNLNLVYQGWSLFWKLSIDIYICVYVFV